MPWAAPCTITMYAYILVEVSDRFYVLGHRDISTLWKGTLCPSSIRPTVGDNLSRFQRHAFIRNHNTVHIL